MEYVNLGRSGLKVSRFSYGNWINSLEDEEAQKLSNTLVKLAWDRGINLFDTAESYDRGKGERQMGIALKALNVPRSDYVVSTKIFFGDFPDNVRKINNLGTSRKRIIEGLDRSLKNLQMDYVDVLFCHRYDYHTPTIEVVRAIKDVLASGKALYWAVSTWPATRIMEAMLLCDAEGCPRPISEQCEYSMLVRDQIEKNYVDLFLDYGLGTTIWSPLCSGILTGKYNEGIPEDSRFGKYKKWRYIYDKYFGSPELAEETVGKLKKLGEVAERIGCSQAQLALAWTLKISDVSSCILGASSEKQLNENIDALVVVEKLTEEVLEEIEGILGNRPVIGYDWRAEADLPFRR